MDIPSDDRGGPLAPERRAELLKRAWALLAEKDYGAIQALLEPLGESELVGEPEFGFVLGAALHRLERTADALRVARAVRNSCERRGNLRLIRERNNLEGALMLKIGRLSEAESCLVQVLEQARVAEDTFYEAVACNNLGIIADIRCDHTEALAYLQRALAGFHQVGHLRGIGNVHQNVGMVYRTLGMLEEADSHLEYAYQLSLASGSMDEVQAAECARALLHCGRGDYRLAEMTALRANSVAEVRSLERSRGEILRALGIIALSQYDGRRAEVYLAEALMISRATDNPLLEAEVLEELAVLAQAEGNDAEMERLIGESAAVYERIGTPARARRARERVGLAEVGGPTPGFDREEDVFD